MEGGTSTNPTPGPSQAPGDGCDINVQSPRPDPFASDWVPGMAEDIDRQNRQLEEEEERMRRELRAMDAQIRAASMMSGGRPAIPPYVITTSSTLGLRYVCTCNKEPEYHALYMRQIFRPAPCAEWAQRYPWISDWFDALFTTCPKLNGEEAVFRAAAANQMVAAITDCESRGHRPVDPRDDKLLAVLGRHIQYTKSHMPQPWERDFYVPCSDFVNAQNLMRIHLFEVLGDSSPAPCEPPPQVEPPPEPVDVPAEPDPLPRPATPPPPEPEAPPPPPVVVDAFPTDPSLPPWGGESEGAPPGPSKLKSPSKAVQTDKKKTKKWVLEWAGSMNKKRAARVLFPRSRSHDRAPVFEDRRHEPEAPSSDDEPYDDTFFDDAPTDNTLFESMAWAGIREGVREVPCAHDLFHKAVQDRTIKDPHLYCAHVRRALAYHIFRHPDKWGVTMQDREMMSILAALGYVRREVLTSATITHSELDYVDSGPVFDLQQMYSVEVSNRYEVLADEPDMLDAHAEDVHDAVRAPAHAAQKAQKRRPTSAKEGAPERDRRQRERQGYQQRVSQVPKPRLSAEERRRNAKAAMRRILSKISDMRVSHEQVAMTVLRQDRAPQVDQLLQEWHSWLRYPTLALQKGLLCWLAACRFNQVKKTTAAAMVLKRLQPISSLCFATGSSQWIRDLTAEGIESNPGPGISAPSIPPTNDSETFVSWCSDRTGLSGSMLTTAKKFAEKELSFPTGVLADVNFAVLIEGYWMPAQAGNSVLVRVPTWTTTLYPSTVAVNGRKLTVLKLAAEESVTTAIASAKLPTGDTLARAYLDSSPVSAEPRRRDRLEHTTPANIPWRDRTRSGVRRLAAASSASPSRESTPTQDERQAPPQEPEGPQFPPEDQYPTRPRTVIAGVNDYNVVIRSARSMGSGVAFAGRHVRSPIASANVRVLVIGRVNHEGHGVGDLHYADRRPIIGLRRGEEEEYPVMVGDVPADQETAAALRALRTDSTPGVRGVGGVRHLLLGEWFGNLGNDVPYKHGWRLWGPLHYVYNARTGYEEGTELIPTAQALAMSKETKDVVTITPRFDLTAHGLDTTTAQALALAKPPGASSCEANAVKLGLLAQWARYGMPDAARHVILTGQLQVHEPNRRICRDTPVTRLVNNTGRPNEDCGGLICPAFPFMEDWKRGRIRFYSSAQAVPTGRRYLVLPPCLENVSDFSEAAAFIISFLPWPFANLSLALDTTDHARADAIKQIFAWYGTTTVVPGELELDVVLHMSNVGRVASRGRDDEPVLVGRPTTGGTGVEFWPPHTPITVNYQGNQDHYIPAASFAVSWALTITPDTVNTVLQKIATAGIFDKVDRWVIEAQLPWMTHAGIMTTDVARLQSEPRGSEEPRVHNTDAEDEDPVPLLYRCWHANGTRSMHIPFDATWCNTRLPPSDSIIVPDVFVITQVVSGYYNWASTFGELSIPIDSAILTPTQFVAAEKLFVAWHIFHSQVGLPVRGLEYGAACQNVGLAECLYYAELFNSHWDPKTNTAQLGCLGVLERVMGGLYLADSCGRPVLHRVLRPLPGRWQPQIWDLQDVNPLDMTTATPMPDVFVFKYSDSLPRHLMPFLVTRSLYGNRDLARTDKPGGTAPRGYYGPYKYKADDMYYHIEPRALPYVDEREVWQNRLMHAMPGYALMIYQDGQAVEGRPRPGEAPISYPRGGDPWNGEPPDFGRSGAVYPYFSSVWYAWVESSSHDVVALLVKGVPGGWYGLLERGVGGMADGLMLDTHNQPLLFRTPVSGKMSGGDRLLAWSGNGYGGESSKGGSSLKNSGGPSQTPSNESGGGQNPDPTDAVA
nr:MAG: capsid protein [Totiviridae sp.]